MKNNEGIRVEEVPSCMLCGSEGVLLYENLRDRLFNAPGIWTLLKCPDCRLVWLIPRPISSDIGKLYEEYYTHNDTCYSSRLSGLITAVRNAILEMHMGYRNLDNSLFLKIFGKMLSLVKPIKERVELGVMFLKRNGPGKLLDVGCGRGDFLAKMRDLGWEVIGLEPDEQLAELAHRRFNLDVRNGTIEQAHFPDDTFDAITVNHVIEHLPDPIGSLQECKRILRKDGKLVILTPNIESLGSQTFGKAWWHLDPPRHFYIFSPLSLKSCVEKTGFNVLALRTSARSANWTWINSYLIHRNGSIISGFQKKEGLWLRLNGMMFKIAECALGLIKDPGEEVFCVSNKKN